MALRINDAHQASRADVETCLRTHMTAIAKSLVEDGGILFDCFNGAMDEFIENVADDYEICWAHTTAGNAIAATPPTEEDADA